MISFKDAQKNLKQLETVISQYPQFEQSLFELQKIIAETEEPLLVMVMGAFSTGKSTFINALLGKEIAVTAAVRTTAVITKIAYGRNKIIAHFIDGSEKNFTPKDFERLTSEREEQSKELRSRIAFVERTLSAPILKKMTLVDSPGLNALNEQHAEITHRFISRADAVLWMTHTEQAGSSIEIAEIEKLNSRFKPIVIVNKMDEVDEEEDDPEDLLQDVRNKVKNRALDVIGISAQQALKGKLKNDKSALLESNIQEVLDKIDSLILAKRDEYKLNSLLHTFGVFLHHVSDRLKAFGEYVRPLFGKNAAEYREHKTAIDSVQKALVDAARPLSDYCDTLTANPDADYFLGVLYSYGIVKQKYTNVARRYFDRAEQTYSDALVMLAVNREPYWRDLLQEAVEAGNAEAAYLCGIELYNKTEAMKLFRSAAEQGYVDAMYEIARKDNDFNFCHAAAEAGHAFAQETLSRLYKNRVNEADSTFTWAKRAAEQGVREIYKTVGDYFAKGYGTPQDDKQAFYWYKRAADNGDRDAQIEVAFACYYGRGTEVDRLKAFVLGDGRVRALYENGPTKDMLLIADAYEFGKGGLTKNIDAANYWYKKAADCFAKGRNVKQDYQQAFYCYKCAANNGDRDAQIEVAFAYYYGRGTEVDRLKAFVLSDANVRALYENGPTEDMLLIADAYEYRKGGLPKSINDAIYWYRKAADRFNIEASYRLGLCCKNFIYSNNEYAFMCYKYLSAASAEGHTAAKNELEKIFSEATGKPQYRIANALETYRFNEQEIFRLYKNAAEKGHAQAQYELGIRYRYGIGTKKSWFKARSWLKKAADKNIRQAQKNYDEMGDEAYNKIFNQKIFIIALLIALFVGVSMYEDNNPPPKSPHKPNPSVSVSHTQTPKPTTRTEEKPKPSRKVHNRSDLSVGGISVDDSLQHVHEILGKEKSVTDPYKTKHFHYQFDGVEVDIYNGKVYSIIVRTNKLETRRGIRVGDSYDDVRLEYGNKNAMEFEKDGILYCEYWFLSPDSKKKSLLRFAIKNGVVNYIGARIYND